MDMFMRHASFNPSMSLNRRSIQDQILEVTVVSGNGLKNTELFGRQDPYVIVKYGGHQYRTKTCSDGGKNPVFQHEKFQFKLVEGLREITVLVYNSNAFSSNDLIGHGKVDLEDVLACGYKESNCLLENNTRSAGEIRLLLRYPNAHKPEPMYAPCPPPSPAPACYHSHAPYPPQYPPPHPPHAYYPPQPISNSNVYPPPISNSNVYPPPPSAPPTYPPSTGYSVYPPPPGPSSYFTPPSSPYHGYCPQPPYNH